MKLINYNYGYHTLFSCTIHGKIIMNRKEFELVKEYLLDKRRRFHFPNIERHTLRQDLERKYIMKRFFMVNVRVYATGLLVEKFNLSNYKSGNYALQVMSKVEHITEQLRKSAI